MISNNSTDSEIVDFLVDVKSRHYRDPALAAELATEYASSGERYDPAEKATADVASTGGPSSLSTLLCPLFLRAAGLHVPKLGVPGRPAGGIDCLAQIAGYRTLLSESELETVMNSAGYAHFLASGRYAPLDGRVFALRQKHGFQDVPTLVAASLLSKKVAVGVRNAGLDIRVAPHGNFGVTRESAAQNRDVFVQAAARLGIHAHPVLTDGSRPYQRYIGRGEALVALAEIFQDTGDAWLDAHLEECRALSVAASPTENRAAIENASRTDLYRCFIANLEAQGASEEAFVETLARIRSMEAVEIVARGDGRLQICLDAIREAIVGLQAEQPSSHAGFNDPAGVVLHHEPDAQINSGDVLATVRIDSRCPREKFLAKLDLAIHAGSPES
ncbi:hypothetical protein KDX27_28245 [Burkholderia cenocepacia]|uniref:hypothetical protein n=1 Tax=Burkholderia cenocepacia TaxID=95486 RepID=UPI001BA08AF2|nr:hypothetical protein [Burkholderia cenocepacia]MBR8024599.1 hypothetical protein [Burkholderia cenocepacia]MBR8171622.1 hypothetical protein [Burkholderia cenocepacia]